MGNKSSRRKKAAAANGAESKLNGSEIKIGRRFSHMQSGVKEQALNMDAFDCLKVLGKGSFGKVMLVRKKDSHKIYAMKVLKKSQLLKRNQIAHTETERNILQNMNHPFLVELHFAFQNEDKLYLVLDFMPGGELFFWLKAQKRFSEPRAKLYAAEILLALEFLHSHDIIYRDLKPENILVDGDGHLRITDFGLSKDGVSGAGPKDGTKTFCGTPEYLAPEILENHGHGKAVDWWSLGTLLYEMLNGLPPFYDTNMQKMYSKILNAPLTIPKHFSPEAAQVCKGLLTRPIKDRLGSGEDGAAGIKSQPFWNSLSWDTVMSKGYSPEFKPPNRSGSLDVSNFDLEFTSQKPADSYCPTNMSSTQLEKTAFPGFTYTGDNAIEE